MNRYYQGHPNHAMHRPETVLAMIRSYETTPQERDTLRALLEQHAPELWAKYQAHAAKVPTRTGPITDAFMRDLDEHITEANAIADQLHPFIITSKTAHRMNDRDRFEFALMELCR
jgi:hypothetical protein